MICPFRNSNRNIEAGPHFEKIPFHVDDAECCEEKCALWVRKETYNGGMLSGCAFTIQAQALGSLVGYKREEIRR